MNIHIPAKNTAAFTLFVKGKIINKITIPEEGTLIETEGVSIVYYKYSSYRRAYIVCDADKTEYLKNYYLPNINPKVSIIYKAQGRKIDLMRQAIYNLEEMSENKVYNLPPIFWQKVSCLLDNFNGYKSAAVKSNLIQLYNLYKNRG